jgi:hypothetical protein
MTMPFTKQLTPLGFLRFGVRASYRRAALTMGAKVYTSGCVSFCRQHCHSSRAR